MLIGLLLGLLLTSLLGQAGNEVKLVEERLEELYVGKLLTLRQFNQGSELVYGPNGALQGGLQAGDWTRHSKLLIRRVAVDPQRITFVGDRVALAYDVENKSWRQLSSQKTVKVVFLLGERGLASPSAGNFQAAFLEHDEPLASLAPLPWQPFLRDETPDARALLEQADLDSAARLELPAQHYTALMYSPDGRALRVAPARTVSGRIIVRSPPAPLALRRYRAPAYTFEALMAGLHGTVIVLASLTTAGKLEHPVIVQPLGLGLDEEVVEALLSWEFDLPAGKPEMYPAASIIQIEFEP